MTRRHRTMGRRASVGARIARTMALAVALAVGRADRGPACAAPPPAPVVSAEVASAVEAWLRAPAKKEQAALAKALTLLKGDVGLAAQALRTHAPLTTGKPGVQHGIAFASGGKAWEYSILLPKGYDGKKRFPVLVLPDHGLVDAAAGIGFWEGKDGVDAYVVFRPVIAKWQEDKDRLPQGFFPRDQAMARVMADAMAHLRLNYAVDADRFVATGLSQAGFYTWYYGVSFPDAFAGLVPESAGGPAVQAAVLPLARNVAGLSVRILHAEGDQICPYADAVALRDALQAAKGRVELVTYHDADYPGVPFPKRHPGPHNLRLSNVLPWGVTVTREIPASFTRVLRYAATQGHEGRFRLPVPDDPTKPVTVTCEEKDGALSCDRPGAVYLVCPEDVVAGRVFTVGGKAVTPKGDVKLLLTSYKADGDRGRLVAAEIPLAR